MTVQSEFNITQVAPVRIGIQFEYDTDAEKWMIKQVAFVDLAFYNEDGQQRQRTGSELTIPPALLATLQSAWDAKLSQYIGAGGQGEGLTIYVPPESEEL